MTSPEHLRLDRQLCLPLYSAANALIRAYGPLLRPLGLTYPQYLVMLALWERDGALITDICTRTRLDTGTVTPLVNRLVAKRLLQKTRGVDDERVRIVTLTAEGRALRDRAEQVPIQMACLGILSPEQGAHMRALADMLYAGLAQRERATSGR